MEIMLLIYDVAWESRKSGVKIVRKKKKKKTTGRREEKYRSKLRDQELQQVGKTKQVLSWKIIWYWTDIKSRLVIDEFIEIYEIKKNKIWSKKKKKGNNAESNNDATINNIFT